LSACKPRRAFHRPPRRRRTNRVADTRELVIPRSPFIAIYRLTGAEIILLRILHGARHLPPEPSPPAA